MTYIDPTTLGALGVVDISQFLNENPGITLGAPPAPPIAANVGGLSTNTASGRAILQSVLRAAGLADSPDLESYISDLVTQGGTVSDWQARLNADLYDTTTVPGKFIDQKYPELALRTKNGHPPISVGDAISYRETATQLAKAEGFPVDMLDFKDLIGNDKGLPEVQSRIHDAYGALRHANPEAVDQLHTLYGLAPGQIAALAFDPTLTVQDVLKRYDTAQIAAAGVRTGYGQLGRTAAEQLAAQGVSADQAQTGFGELAQITPLFTPLTGDTSGPAITQDQQLAAEFGGNAAARRKIEDERARRKATFAGGGGFGATQRGVGGLGRADVG